MDNQMSETPTEKETFFFKPLTGYIHSNVLDFSTIPEERKTQLNDITDYISGKVGESKPVNLLFICTHNSRRSQMSQLWAQVASSYYQIPQIFCYSGGTEATAFNTRAVNALKKAGFQMESDTIGSNPVYRVSYADGVDPVKAFSKKFSHPVNPHNDFIAVMTCSDADEACPVVPGASARFSIPYEDPGTADGTPEEESIYDERCQQIATEMVYLFAQVK